MENSENEIEAQKLFISPPRRRRSTFFEKRNSFVPQPLTENIDPNIGNKKPKEMDDDKHNLDLLRYHDALLAEKNQWKKEVNHRQNKYHEVRQQYRIATNAPSSSRISYSALSNEDIEFLKGKINISHFVDSQSKFHKSVIQVQELYRKVIQLDSVLLEECEKKLNQVTDYILENSTVELKQ